MDSNDLKKFVQFLFDSLQAALKHRPLILVALMFAEEWVMDHWDEWFAKARAAGVVKGLAVLAAAVALAGPAAASDPPPVGKVVVGAGGGALTGKPLTPTLWPVGSADDCPGGTCPRGVLDQPDGPAASHSSFRVSDPPPVRSHFSGCENSHPRPVLAPARAAARVVTAPVRLVRRLLGRFRDCR